MVGGKPRLDSRLVGADHGTRLLPPTLPPKTRSGKELPRIGRSTPLVRGFILRDAEFDARDWIEGMLTGCRPKACHSAPWGCNIAGSRASAASNRRWIALPRRPPFGRRTCGACPLPIVRTANRRRPWTWILTG